MIILHNVILHISIWCKRVKLTRGLPFWICYKSFYCLICQFKWSNKQLSTCVSFIEKKNVNILKDIYLHRYLLLPFLFRAHFIFKLLLDFLFAQPLLHNLLFVSELLGWGFRLLFGDAFVMFHPVRTELWYCKWKQYSFWHPVDITRRVTYVQNFKHWQFFRYCLRGLVV